MGLYKLNYSNNLADGILSKTNKEPIDYEKDFENWLENSPHVLFDDDDLETVMWIGRQVSACSDYNVRYPDLIGINSSGDLVIVELKKGKTPREVVAQILEYASWASKLSYQELNSMALKYYEKDEQFRDCELVDIFNSIFYPGNESPVEIKFNISQLLFIVAEEISPVVKDIVNYLNQKGNIEINCLEYEVYKTENGELIVSTERLEGLKKEAKHVGDNNRWNEEVKVKDVVKQAVNEITKGSFDVTFSPKDVVDIILRDYPGFNKSSAGCQLIQDCVNHSSRRHYKGGQQDLYFLVGKGEYRLYNCSGDGSWDWQGKRVEE